MGALSTWHYLIVILLIANLYTLYRWCLSYKLLLLALSDRYQKFSPNLSFLLFVPVIGFFWWWYMAYHIKSALNEQMGALHLAPSDDGGFVLSLIAIVSFLLSLLPHIGWILGIGAFIFWILSWVKVVNTRKRISGS